MPELPEAETIARQLAAQAVARIVRKVTVRSPRAVRSHRSRAEFARLVEGRRIAAVGRRGKAVLLFLNGKGPATLIVRLGMSGQLRLSPSRRKLEDHARAILQLSGGCQLRFIDPRQFGLLVARNGAAVDQLPEFWGYGPEPLSPEFTPTSLRRALARRSARLGVALMDQRLVAGIGKIYADEACFRAGLAPARPANSLAEGDCRRLWSAVRRVLRAAIRLQGTSSADEAYLDSYGNRGRFRERLMVYQRTGQPCRVCGTRIKRQRLTGGRGLHWCPRCQE